MILFTFNDLLNLKILDFELNLVGMRSQLFLLNWTLTINFLRNRLKALHQKVIFRNLYFVLKIYDWRIFFKRAFHLFYFFHGINKKWFFLWFWLRWIIFPKVQSFLKRTVEPFIFSTVGILFSQWSLKSFNWFGSWANLLRSWALRS